MSEISKLESMQCTVADGLARVVLNRPDRGNAIDGEFCRDLRNVMSELSQRDDVRAVLLSSTGRFFSVGGDVKVFAQSHEAMPGIVQQWTTDIHAGIARMMRMRAPVVAAVQGPVAGGTVSVMAAADIVVASETATFTSAFPMLGFSCDSGSTVSLSQRMGFSRAKRFLLLSENLKAMEAQAVGLVDVVCKPDQVAAEAEAIAQKFAKGPTVAYGGIKRLMMTARTQPAETQMEDEGQTLTAVTRTADAWEGVRAFVEKRAPKFQGK